MQLTKDDVIEAFTTNFFKQFSICNEIYNNNLLTTELSGSEINEGLLIVEKNKKFFEKEENGVLAHYLAEFINDLYINQKYLTMFGFEERLLRKFNIIVELKYHILDNNEIDNNENNHKRMLAELVVGKKIFPEIIEFDFEKWLLNNEVSHYYQKVLDTNLVSLKILNEFYEDKIIEAHDLFRKIKNKNKIERNEYERVVTTLLNHSLNNKDKFKINNTIQTIFDNVETKSPTLCKSINKMISACAGKYSKKMLKLNIYKDFYEKLIEDNKKNEENLLLLTSGDSYLRAYALSKNYIKNETTFEYIETNMIKEITIKKLNDFLLLKEFNKNGYIDFSNRMVDYKVINNEKEEPIMKINIDSTGDEFRLGLIKKHFQDIDESIAVSTIKNVLQDVFIDNSIRGRSYDETLSIIGEMFQKQVREKILLNNLDNMKPKNNKKRKL